MDTSKALISLAGKDLSSFKIEKVFDVWTKNELGIKSKDLGTFKNETVARAFANNDNGGYGTGVGEIFVLTNGTTAFLLDSNREVKFFDDETEALKIRTAALAKLSTEEKTLLGIS